MGSLEAAVRGSQRLETVLETRFGALGRGLHEKVSSVERSLPADLVKRIRWVASVRNGAVHEGKEISDAADFERKVDQAVRRLEATPPGKGGAAAPRTRGPRRGRIRVWLRGLAGLALAIAAGVVFFAPGSSPVRRLRGAVREGLGRLVPTSRGDAPAPAGAAATRAKAAPEDSAGMTGQATRALGGSLGGLAKQTSAELAAAKADLDANFWGVLQKQTHIAIGQPQVKDNGDGTHDVNVPVKFNVAPKPLLATLNKYLWGFGHRPLVWAQMDFRDHLGPKAAGISVRGRANQAGDAKRPFSAELYDYLVAKQARIRVVAGKHSGVLTLASGRKCFVACEEAGTDQFQVEIDNRRNPGVTVFDKGQGEANPIVIHRVPSAELTSVGSLSASVEIVARGR